MGVETHGHTKPFKGGEAMIVSMLTGAAVAVKVLAVAKTVSTVGALLLSTQTIIDGVRTFIDKD